MAKILLVTIVVGGTLLGLLLISTPGPAPPAKILGIDLAYESYFVIDKEMVDSTFDLAEQCLGDLSRHHKVLQNWSFVFSWLGYILGMIAAVTAIIVRRNPFIPPNPGDTIALAQLATSHRMNQGKWGPRAIIGLVLLAILSMGAGYKLQHEAQVLLRKMYQLRMTAAYTRCALDNTSSIAEALNLLERLKHEVARSR